MGPSPALPLGVPLAALVALALYLAAVRRERRRGRAWSSLRTASFAAGVAVVIAAAAPPAARWAHHDLRGHMAQHVALGMLAPLALVLAAPATLALRALPVRLARRATAALRRPAVHRLTHPATALLLDTGALYLLYLTPLFAATLASPALHLAVHVHFLAAGCLFAWSLVGPDPAPGRRPLRVRLAVLAVAIAAHSTLAKVMYAYGWPRGTSHHPDQLRAAAQVMYYGGDLAELLLLVALFAAWYRRPGRAASGGRPVARPVRSPPACPLPSAPCSAAASAAAAPSRR